MLKISLHNPLTSPELIDTAQHLLSQALPSDLLDDRFSHNWQQQISPSESYKAVLASDASGRIVAMLEHWLEDSENAAGAIRLEALMDRRFDEPGKVDEGVETLHRLFTALAEATTQDMAATAPQLWARPTTASIEGFVKQHQANLDRHLFQMRRELASWEPPNRDDSVAFQPSDLDDLIKLNNRAFADHPDQANMTRASFEQTAAEAWFNPDGLRVWRRGATLAAFCWTKIHQAPALGEIYVIGVNPEFQGQGLGHLATSSGIRWLKGQAQAEVMLYVEATNTAAVSVYRKLGFETVREDKAWRMPSLSAWLTSEQQHQSNLKDRK